ncbi:MAG: hypothetical protein U0531_10475 [Dehalococcoidia bacterium]
MRRAFERLAGERAWTLVWARGSLCVPLALKPRRPADGLPLIPLLPDTERAPA